MSNLRWILLILGILLVAGIYLFEKRRNTEPRGLRNKIREPAFEDVNQEKYLEDDFSAEISAGENAYEIIEPQLKKSAPSFKFPHEENQDILNTNLEFADLTDLIREAVLDPHPVMAKAIEKAGLATMSQSTVVADKKKSESSLINGNIAVIYLLALDPVGLHGPLLKQVLSKLNIHYGEQHIFHYAENAEKLFSIANLVEPGIFDLTTINTFKTPGLAVYMLLDKLEKPSQAFERMLQIVWELSNQLQAKICDVKSQTMNQLKVGKMLEDIKAYEHNR